MKMVMFLVAGMIALGGCKKWRVASGEENELIGDGYCLKWVTFPPKELRLGHEACDTVIKLDFWKKIYAMRTIVGFDTLNLLPGRDFPHAEGDSQRIDLGWVTLEKKAGSYDLYVSVEENDTLVRRCEMGFERLAACTGFYRIRQAAKP